MEIKKLIPLLLLALTSCTPSGSDFVEPKDADQIPEQVIRFDKLINLSNGLVASDGQEDVVTQLDLSYTDSEFNLVKRIVLFNPTEEDKALDIKFLDNERMGLGASTCKSVLKPQEKCLFYLKHYSSTLYNGVYTGLLNIAQDQSAQITVVSTLNRPSLAAPVAQNLEDLLVDMLTDDFYSFETTGEKSKVIKISNNDKKNYANPISFNISENENFYIIYNSCALGLGAKQSCYVRIKFKGSESEQIPAELSLSLTSGEQQLPVNLITPPEVTSFALSLDKKSLTISGMNLKYVKTVKLLQGTTELENFVLVHKDDGVISLNFSKNFTLTSNTPYTIRLE